MTPRRSVGMTRWRNCALLGLLACVSACASGPPDDLTGGGPALSAHPVKWSRLAGWAEDDHAAALAAFRISCAAPATRNVEALADALRASCARVPADNADARAFFEREFVPYRLGAKRKPGKLTGYFEPTYRASRTAEGTATAPVLTLPTDLLSVDLGAFDPSLAGRRLAGRVEGQRLVPYADHAGIIAAPPPSSSALGYVDPNDLLFLQIQGSGRLQFADGTELRVGYAGQNGHKYHPVGRTLLTQGALAADNISMQTIKEWLGTAPSDDAARVRTSNPSYVFFRVLDALPDPALGPIGSTGVQLSAGRSLAVDPRFVPYGAPVFVEAPGLAALTIAQDTGGAIRGAARGDLYIGTGDAAGEIAGRMNAEAAFYLLVPRASLPLLTPARRQPGQP